MWQRVLEKEGVIVMADAYIGGQLPCLEACENPENRTIPVSWQVSEELVSVPFCQNGAAVEGSAWAVSLRCLIRLDEAQNRTGTLTLCAEHDENNHASFLLMRDMGGTSGIRRYICRDGVRLQRKGNELVMDTPTGENWSAELTFLFCQQHVCLFMAQKDGDMELVSAYPVNWTRCSAQLRLQQGVEAELSGLTVLDDPAQVQALYDRLMKPAAPIDTARILFLGNSCIFYYDVPNTLARLAKHAGYQVEVNTVARSSARIEHFVDPEYYLYTLARREMVKGYDAVSFHGLSTDIDTPEQCERVRQASAVLAAEIRAAGAKPYMYNRPARLLRDMDKDGIRESLVVITNAKAYDALYGGISRDLDMDCAYINRAFALAYQEKENVKLWYRDDAHSSALGGYLAACVLFASYFHTSCENVGDGGLEAEDAAFLRQIADRVALKGEIPNW